MYFEWHDSSFLDRKNHLKRQDESNDIFGALLQPQESPVTTKKDDQFMSKWPIKVDETHRAIQEVDICDVFVINGEVIIVKVVNKSIEIQELKFLDIGVECRPLFTVIEGISDLCVNFPSTYAYMNIICQKNVLLQASGIIELERNLFSSLFSLTNALQRSLIFIYGDENGNILMCPFAIGMQEGKVLKYSDSANVFCSMGQPLIAMLCCTVKEFSVLGTGTVSAKDKDTIDKSIASVKEAYTKETVLVLVGSLGKVIIILDKLEEYIVSIFNTCHVSGPILSATTLDNLFIYGTGDSLHLSKMVISLQVEDKKKLSIVPSLQPVYSIALPVIGISKNIIKTTVRDSKLDFYCADANGWILKVFIDNVFQNIETSSISSNINYLLTTLESLQKDFHEWQSMLEKQNSVLGELQNAASMTTNVMQSRDDEFASELTKPSAYCCLDSVSIGTDGVLYLEISIHNLPNYALQSNWFLQFVGKARQKASNSLYGSLKKFSKIVALHSLQLKAVIQWKISFNIEELQIFLPIEIEFKLAIPFHESYNSRLKTAEMIEGSCIVLPLNSVIITVLDIMHIHNYQSLIEEASRNDAIFHSQHGNCVCHFCSVLPVFSSIECRQYNCKNAQVKGFIVLSVPSLALQCLLQDEKQNDAKVFVKMLIAHLFPYNSSTSIVELDGPLLLVLPCQQQIRISLIYDSCDGSNVNTSVPRLQLEGYSLPLLLAIYSAILVRLQVWKDQLMQFSCKLIIHCFLLEYLLHSGA